MADRWMIQSHTFVNCSCAANCGCQFNLPSTHGYCQFVEGGNIVDGQFNGVSLSGLKWAFVIDWPGEIAEGGGTRQVVIDERADAVQREALETIVACESCAPGSNHFFVFGSMCSTFLDTRHLPIEFAIDIPNRTARMHVPGLIESFGEPIIDAFSGKPFHIALARPTGSFEFTYAEIGAGTSKVTGALPMNLDHTYGQFCVHHYDQDGLVQVA
jgi:hypothetical protein